MTAPRIAVLVGSLRKDSFTRKIAKALVALAPEDWECSIIEIGDLPLYNEDLEDDAPAAWTRFRAAIRGHDAVLFATPEYNRSIPGCLKNALDVGSRPQGKSVWSGLPAGVVSVTPYKLGAFGANHALRQTFVFLDMPVMQQPEAYIGGAGELFDGNGKLKSKETQEFLAKFMTAFARWIAAHPQAPTSFKDFLKQRKKIALAYTRGDAAPLDEILPRSGEAGFFSPNGDHVEGAEKVKARYDKDAKMFGPGGEGSLDILQSGSDGALAFWTGIQEAKAHIKGKDKAVAMKLRITELFRFEDGGWKLFHRHADMPQQK
jgi:NAD(P)H-dependent FMN reductase/ketosteroid isomerase-like protein